jgi:hypothetical protein
MTMRFSSRTKPEVKDSQSFPAHLESEGVVESFSIVEFSALEYLLEERGATDRWVVEVFVPQHEISTVVCRLVAPAVSKLVRPRRKGPPFSASYPYALFLTMTAWSSRKNVSVMPSGSKIFLVVNSRNDMPLTRLTMMANSVQPVLQ